MPPESVLTPPAAPVATTATPAPTPGATTPPAGDVPDWAKDWPEDIRAPIVAKGYKSPQDVATAYIAAQKLLGVPAERILKVPEKADDAAGWAEIHNKLGRPEKIEGYTVPEALAKDPIATQFPKLFHELGLSKKQGETLLTTYNDAATKLIAERDKSDGELLATQQTKRFDTLKTEQGATFPEFLEDARRATRTAVPETYKDPATGAELTRAEIMSRIEGAIGVDLAVRIFNTLGKFTAEDKSITGGKPASGIATLEGAVQRKQALMSDTAWVKKWGGGDVEARSEMAKLDEVIAAARSTQPG